MTLVWRPGFQFDADASTYIEAVEAADTQALETGVRYAINDFVIGCKNDGIWDAIKASCILAGARTLAGALVPLVGTAPTNYNFVSGDYNRETGLVGDGSTKYLDSNRNNNDDPQDNRHRSAFVTVAQSSGFGVFVGAGASYENGADYLGFNQAVPEAVSRCLAGVPSGVLPAPSLLQGFFGHSRAQASNYSFRFNTNTNTILATSVSATTGDINIFSRDVVPAPARSNARLAFYSIGESLDLAALDTRVSDLITAIGAAIP